MSKSEIKRYILILIKYFFQWKFKLNFVKSFGLFIMAEVVALGGYSWIIAGHIKVNNDMLQSDVSWRISQGEANMYGVLIGAIILIGFLAFLFYHDKNEIRKQMKNNKEDDLFIQVYIPVFDHIFDMLDIKNYRYWTHNLAVSGNTRMKTERYSTLRELVEYCKDIRIIDGLQNWNLLIDNLSLVINDLLDIFDLHARLIGEDTYDFEKFYRGRGGWNENYDKQHHEYLQEIYLIGNLTYELTRLANFILEEIRQINCSYQAEFGVFNIVDAVDKNKNVSPIVYTDTEKHVCYPGLCEFVEKCNDRIHCYPVDISIIEVLEEEGIL